ncbi:DUF63 family protein [Saliphagus infecundisoli]|uniref:DUF63 family protein n=1 Tax=Saliphagus infecundisoli TaxID=1849069 RepID=A0ABD5QC49_9EURY|nr:DUF63 family protein [Saliphagus infecundisoli]
MSTPLTTDRTGLIPPTGSRNWWLLYVGGPVMVVFSAILLFPELVYERFIWQYLWGPVVADANGEPVTRYGIQVTEGYTLVNTIAYLGIVLYSLPGLWAFHDALSIDLTTRLAYSLAPIIVAGGAMRALADASLLGSLDVWFITPSIYFVVAGIALASIAVGTALRDRGLLSIPATVGIVGATWAMLALGWILLYGLTAAETFRPLVPVLTLSIAIVVTGGFYLAGSVTGWSALHHPMYLLVIFGQMWDAAQNLVGVTLYGYTPKMFLTQQLYRWTGFEGSTFAVKLLVVTFVVWILVDGENDLPREQWWLIAMVIIVVGLPMGVRGTTRMMLGV